MEDVEVKSKLEILRGAVNRYWFKEPQVVEDNVLKDLFDLQGEAGLIDAMDERGMEDTLMAFLEGGIILDGREFRITRLQDDAVLLDHSTLPIRIRMDMRILCECVVEANKTP